MSLTSDDLKQIDKIVTGAITGVISGLATTSELKDAVSGLATKSDLDRLEGRLATTINLLQRDTFDRLDQHEARIVRLEKAIAK
ncbi:MAG TPA: hypothetical protein VMS08_05485 [Candidatus Saccharimonadia bacterium]|nr:hypothetical protein [Candidatus Saccharimonadia bacterium]